jgi:hypothetical protein
LCGSLSSNVLRSDVESNRAQDNAIHDSFPHGDEHCTYDSHSMVSAPVIASAMARTSLVRAPVFPLARVPTAASCTSTDLLAMPLGPCGNARLSEITCNQWDRLKPVWGPRAGAVYQRATSPTGHQQSWSYMQCKLGGCSWCCLGKYSRCVASKITGTWGDKWTKGRAQI